MAKYRSNLTALHKIRSAARDAQQQRVADAVRAQAALEEQASAIQMEVAVIKQVQKAVHASEIDVARLLEIERYELVLKTQADGINKQQELVAAELERRVEKLAAAEQQVRVVEKLDNRRRVDFERRESRRDQAVLDEIATNQYLLKRRQARISAKQART